jgi:hypothetical protein
LTGQPVFLLVDHSVDNSTMDKIMTYTTELERKKNIIITFTRYVEKDYNGMATMALRQAYSKMYDHLKETPVAQRMNVIDEYEFEVKAPASVPVDLSREKFIANILGKLMATIFTLTHMDLKEDLLEAMKSIE